MPRVLLIEDEVGIRLTVGDRLRAEGYEVEDAADGLAGYERACEGGIDLIVLDLMLPGKPGLDVCRELREGGVSTPLLMLTAKDQLMDRVRGLKIGADDYLVKPFAMPELLARVEAILRRGRMRAGTAGRSSYAFGDLRIETKQAAAFRDGERLQLSAKEYQLLLYFVQHPRELLSREVLLRNVWHYEAVKTTRTVDVHVGWLRQKLEADPARPRRFVTRRGLGYIFEPE